MLQDPAKKEFAEELFSYTDKFNGTVYTAFKGDLAKEAGKIQIFLSFHA